MNERIVMGSRSVLAIGLTAMIGTAGLAQADIISADFSTVLLLDSGADAAGLDGASFSIHAEFDSDGVYVDLFGIPALHALSHSMTISGASIGGSDGVYVDANGLAYFPTFANGFFSGAGEFLVAGPLSLAGMETGPGTTIPFIGDQVQLTDFNTTSFDPRDLLMVGIDGSTYTWGADASFSVTLVPAPGTLALLGLGGLCATRRRR